MSRLRRTGTGDRRPPHLGPYPDTTFQLWGPDLTCPGTSSSGTAWFSSPLAAAGHRRTSCCRRPSCLTQRASHPEDVRRARRDPADLLGQAEVVAHRVVLSDLPSPGRWVADDPEPVHLAHG